MRSRLLRQRKGPLRDAPGQTLRGRGRGVGHDEGDGGERPQQTQMRSAPSLLDFGGHYSTTWDLRVGALAQEGAARNAVSRRVSDSTTLAVADA